MEAAKGGPYCRPILEAVKLLSKAAEEEDYNVIYSIDGVHRTFNIRYAPNLYSSLFLSDRIWLVICIVCIILQGDCPLWSFGSHTRLRAVRPCNFIQPPGLGLICVVEAENKRSG
jgi:hypothetical protein